VTVSVGVASSDGHACDLDVLLADADRALYRAKANGRNRVESGDPLWLSGWTTVPNRMIAIADRPRSIHMGKN
jgi:hypothetical protein